MCLLQQYGLLVEGIIHAFLEAGDVFKAARGQVVVFDIVPDRFDA